MGDPYHSQMSKTEQLQIRVSAEQKALIKARAARAGEDVSSWVLGQVLPAEHDVFGRLVGLLANSPDTSHRLAELHDFLAGWRTGALSRAVRLLPTNELGAFEANYLAAMVEHTCVARGIEIPTWVCSIEPLPRPWFASSLKNLRLHLLTRSPAAFRRRNLFIDSTIGERV